MGDSELLPSLENQGIRIKGSQNQGVRVI